MIGAVLLLVEVQRFCYIPTLAPATKIRDNQLLVFVQQETIADDSEIQSHIRYYMTCVNTTSRYVLNGTLLNEHFQLYIFLSLVYCFQDITEIIKCIHSCVNYTSNFYQSVHSGSSLSNIYMMTESPKLWDLKRGKSIFFTLLLVRM